MCREHHEVDLAIFRKLVIEKSSTEVIALLVIDPQGEVVREGVKHHVQEIVVVSGEHRQTNLSVRRFLPNNLVDTADVDVNDVIYEDFHDARRGNKNGEHFRFCLVIKEQRAHVFMLYGRSVCAVESLVHLRLAYYLII